MGTLVEPGPAEKFTARVDPAVRSTCPRPVGNSGWIARDIEGGLVSPKTLGPKEAWAPVPTVPPPMFKRGDRDDPEPEVFGSMEIQAEWSY